MRLYEFAKEHDISSKDLLQKLRDRGFEVNSHMSVLNNEEISFLQQQFSSKDQKKKLKKESLEKEVPVLADLVEEKKITTTATAKNSSVVLEKPFASEHKELVISGPEETPQESMTMVMSNMTLEELAKKIRKPINELIVLLLKQGVVTTKNQLVSELGWEKIAKQYNIVLSKPTVNVAEETESVSRFKKEKTTQKGIERAPIFVVIGHVDHGKTTFLDYVRSTRVAAKEKGGITQHIGAYEVKTSHGEIVFIDTPGHEAFGKLRQRGIKVADIAILMVAADDGVMPQTVEAIRQAKIGQLPIVVAINKIDKADPAAIDRVKQQLAQYDVLVEDWGGDVVCVPISAKTGVGVDQLLEMLVLQSQLMDLRADKDVPGCGYVLESRLEKGKGAVATIISYNGSVKLGDYFSCGGTTGHITALTNSYGKSVQSAGPSVPVRVSGFDDLPDVGDMFKTVTKEEYRKLKTNQKRTTLSSVEGGKRFVAESVMNIVLKVDTYSSLEAILDSIEKVSQKMKKGITIVFAGVGNVNEGDVETAATTNSMIITFHVKIDQKALALAQGRVQMQSFDIIYRLIEFLQEQLAEPIQNEAVLKKTGEAIVLKVFDIKNVGVIAGSQIKDGIFTRKASVVIWRNNKKVGEGKIVSLQRDKKSVKEVTAGYECGFVVEGFKDFEVGDRVECFTEQ